MEVNKQTILQAPNGVNKVLLHTCCAPCSVAIIESMMNNGIEPTIFFCNPNIYPQAEYEKRKTEIIRYAKGLELNFIDADYSHEDWLKETQHLKEQPERGERCQVCFNLRLNETARYAQQNDFEVFATTLGSSRWKDLEQIDTAGQQAAKLYPNLIFWNENWRKNGLSNRQADLIKEYDFYRQQYCGCEFSKK